MNLGIYLYQSQFTYPRARGDPTMKYIEQINTHIILFLNQPKHSFVHTLLILKDALINKGLI